MDSDDDIQRISRKYLPSGPWHADFKKYPNLQYKFNYKNYDCAVRRGGVWAWCGYVKIPENHPYHEKKFR